MLAWLVAAVVGTLVWAIYGCEEQQADYRDCEYFLEQEGDYLYEYHWLDDDDDAYTPCIREPVRVYRWLDGFDGWFTTPSRNWRAVPPYGEENPWEIIRNVNGQWQHQHYAEMMYGLDVFEEDELDASAAWSDIGDQLQALADFIDGDSDYAFDEDMAAATAEGLSFDPGYHQSSGADLVDYWHPSYDDVVDITPPNTACTTFKSSVLDYYEEIGWGEDHTIFEDHVVATGVTDTQLDISIYDGEDELFDITITKSGGEITSVTGTVEGETLSVVQQEHPILVYQAVLDNIESKKS